MYRHTRTTGGQHAPRFSQVVAVRVPPPACAVERVEERRVLERKGGALVVEHEAASSSSRSSRPSVLAVAGASIVTTTLYHRRRRPVNAAMAEALTETRWLTPHHRQQLAEGRLRLPDQGNHFGYDGHPAVLVSTPDGFGSPAAWIDRDMAELIWRLNRMDVGTLECCQGGGYDVWSGRESAYIAFADRHGCDLFLALAGDALRGEQVEGRLRERCVRFPHSQVRPITRAVRNA